MRIPGTTYRLQLNRAFTFEHARSVLTYLRDLGVTDVYASSILQAGPDSTHGYDTCCAGSISSTLGGEQAFENLCLELKRLGVGLLLDIVPNHMAASASNAWWWDVLKYGRSSSFADFFDIDWDRGAPPLRGKVVLPVLGERLAKVIQAGELRIVREGGEFHLGYFDHRFPLSPQTPSELLARIRGAGETPLSQAELVQLLDAQHYRLAFWRAGPEEINYRRFFEVSELVALRADREPVFAATHDLIFELMQKGNVTGLRVDHPDGLLDPEQYFERLQELARQRTGSAAYVVAEKILSEDEELPAQWPIQGTTGYDFLNQVNGLFVARRNELEMTRIYQEFTGVAETFDELARRGKGTVIDQAFIGDLDSLADLLFQIAATTIVGRDFTWRELRAALRELIICLPAYRTYTRDGAADLRPADSVLLDQAARQAAAATGLAEPVSFVHALLSFGVTVSPDQRKPLMDLIQRFQQLSGPAAAKGIEDTAFYNYNRLLSLNEVGGNPARFGISVEEFPSQQPAPRRPLATHPARHRNPRYQAWRRRPRAHQCPFRNAGNLARDGHALA